MSNNFEHCHVHPTDFLSIVMSNLFIRARTVTIDRILITEKTTGTPRVHLVIYNNDIAAARVELWSSSIANAKYADESSSTNYTFCVKSK